MKNKKICIAASAGGHLTEVLQLKEIWKGKDYFYISDNRINAISLYKKEKVYFILPPRRSYTKTGIAFIQTLLIFLKERPDIIISTGAEIGYPALMLGRLFRKKTIYIETMSRISPSLCGKLVYPFVTNFYVQWPESKKFFPKAKYVGSVF
ncbi:MAG: UDP-N-acetylglucosamine--LPS N-acetylglucosamine transferase [Candidatus ainarchaeum sp.]|nr:UDP-N-acetylglucosamine--LPS N-acetylglucosamine transferase [Candidatus ainarchaeum sp.]